IRTPSFTGYTTTMACFTQRTNKSSVERRRQWPTPMTLTATGPALFTPMVTRCPIPTLAATKSRPWVLGLHTSMTPEAMSPSARSTTARELGNKGGLITVLDKNGLKVDGVSYTEEQAKKEGWTIVF